jgi:hypothetical protein
MSMNWVFYAQSVVQSHNLLVIIKAIHTQMVKISNSEKNLLLA